MGSSVAKLGNNIRLNVGLLPAAAEEFRETYEREGMTRSEAARAAVRDWVKARRPSVTVRPA